MILSATIALAALLQQAPRPTGGADRPVQRPAPSQAMIQPTTSDQPKTPFDTTVAALTDIGTKVAEVRSAYELYRRAVFNDPNGAVVERAGLYRGSCRSLSAAVVQGERRICRSCLPRDVQPAIDRYRAHLPSLRRLADQCSARITGLKARGNELAVAAALRADIRPEGERLVNGLRLYEARVAEVRHVMGWDQRPVSPTPRRGN